MEVLRVPEAAEHKAKPLSLQMQRWEVAKDGKIPSGKHSLPLGVDSAPCAATALPS